jgi:YbgC/YbaW family acyl-CoA thioester hydrolase
VKEPFPETPQFVYRRRVQFAETDMAGIVHFSQFYKYMEEAEHEFFRSLGLSIMHHSEDGSIIGWPRVSANCNFEGSAYFEDVLEVRLAVYRKGVKSITYNFEFWRGDSRIVRGTMKTVCCQFERGEKMKSIVIPDAYADKIKQDYRHEDT